MAPTVATKDDAEKSWAARNALGIYVATVGLSLLAVGATFAYLGRGGAVAVTLATLGAAALILAPLFPSLESIQIGSSGISLSLRRQVARLVKEAPPETLEGVLPLLSDEQVRVRVGTVPPRFAGKTLKDLAYIRQDLLITVMAVEETGRRWMAGGMVSDRMLREGERLLVAGPPEITEAFVRILWEQDDERFEQEVRALTARARLLRERTAGGGAPGT